MINTTGNGNGRVTAETRILLNIKVEEQEVVSELLKHAEGVDRDRYVLSALRLGVLSLRMASGQVDGAEVRREGERLMTNFEALLSKRDSELVGGLRQELSKFFSPENGTATLKITQLTAEGGELDRLLNSKLGSDNSDLARTLVEHVGEGSPILKMLSPTDSGGLKAQLIQDVKEVLNERDQSLISEFSLDNEESSLSRIVNALKKTNGELTTDVRGEIRSVLDEFSTDNEHSAISRILNNLSLDNDSSALNRLNKTLTGTINEMRSEQKEFITEVRETLSALNERKKEAARSTRHGEVFEEQLGGVISKIAQGASDIYRATGNTTGTIRHCKKGDHVVTFGPESAVEGVNVVWEAKEDKSYDLQKALDENREAKKNREAQVSVFVFSAKSAPEGLERFCRYGNDIVIIWDAENSESDLFIDVAYSLSKYLSVRANSVSGKTGGVVNKLDPAIQVLERQIKYMDEIVTWSKTAKNSAEKTIERAEKVRDEVRAQLAIIAEQVSVLKAEDGAVA